MFDSVIKANEQATKPKDKEDTRRKLELPRKLQAPPAIPGSTSIASISMPTGEEHGVAAAVMRVDLTNATSLGFRKFELINSFADGASVPLNNNKIPLEIQFRPMAASVHRGEAKCSITWQDTGEHEVRMIQLEGHGVAPTDTETETDKNNADPSDIDRIKLDLRKATSSASSAARALARKQLRAVDRVEYEVMTYKKAEPKQFPWWELAGLALSIATGGIGGAVATALAPKLASLISKHAIDKVATEAPKIMSAVTEGIQSGISGAGAFGLALTERAVSEALDDTDKGEESIGLSSNARINFFASQREKLDEIGETYASTIEAQEIALQPLIRTSPHLAGQAMESIQETCMESAKGAKLKQADATTAQWISGVAQGKAGKRNVYAWNLQKTVVTDFTKGYSVDAASRYGGGVLRLRVQALQDGVKVTSAAIDGVPQEHADRIRTRPLSDIKIPVRIAISAINESHNPDHIIPTTYGVAGLRVTRLDMCLPRAQFHDAPVSPLRTTKQQESASATRCLRSLSRSGGSLQSTRMMRAEDHEAILHSIYRCDSGRLLFTAISTAC